jgi:hypothetical protein
MNLINRIKNIKLSHTAKMNIILSYSFFSGISVISVIEVIKNKLHI